MWKKCNKKELSRKCLKMSHKTKGIRWKARNKWLGHGENDLKKMGVRGWRKIAGNRDAWKLILKETTVLYGLYRQWSKRSRNVPSTVNLMSKGKY
jgi:hypothetical protein